MNFVNVTSSCVIGQRVVSQYIQPHVSVYDVGLVGSECRTSSKASPRSTLRPVLSREVFGFLREP